MTAAASTVSATCTTCGAKFAMTDTDGRPVTAYLEWDARHRKICSPPTEDFGANGRLGPATPPDNSVKWGRYATDAAQAIHEAHTTMTYSLADIANGDTGALDPKDCPVCTPAATDANEVRA